MENIEVKQLFKLMRDSVHNLSSAAIRGKEYAHDNGIVIALEHDFLITAINKLEDSIEREHRNAEKCECHINSEKCECHINSVYGMWECPTITGESDNNDSGKPLSPFEMVGEFDENDGETFEMMASVCESIRDLADAYGGDKHYNNCVLMALRSCISALEGLNK